MYEASRILISVDESGMSSQTERLFVVAGVWCAPETKSGHQQALSHTVDQIKLTIREKTGKWPDEIHFASGLKRFADELMDLCLQRVLSDYSIFKVNVPWIGSPLRFTYDVHAPGTETKLPFDSTDMPNTMRARALARVLQPLSTYEGEVKLEVAVVLDAETWKPCLDRYMEFIRSGLSNSSMRIDFTCANSKNVPGLQIADLAAGSIRTYLIDGQCSSAFQNVNSCVLHRVSTGRPAMVRPLEEE